MRIRLRFPAICQFCSPVAEFLRVAAGVGQKQGCLLLTPSTGQVLIMTPEEREKFDAFVKGMMTELAPVGTHETFLANSMAEEAWRLNQIRARCANLVRRRRFRWRRRQISAHGRPESGEADASKTP